MIRPLTRPRHPSDANIWTDVYGGRQTARHGHIRIEATGVVNTTLFNAHNWQISLGIVPRGKCIGGFLDEVDGRRKLTRVSVVACVRLGVEYSR